MKTLITTSLTVTKQAFSRDGDASDTPIVWTDKQEFDNDEDVDAFVECIDIWHLEYPKPNGNFNPFRRVKTPPTEERLFEILDEFHGPGDLWAGGLPTNEEIRAASHLGVRGDE
jgi:hypothetical protein